MIIEIVILTLTAFVGYFFYMHKKNHKYFDERGIKYLPGVPFFGNMMKNSFLRCHFIDEMDAVYKAFPRERYVGFIEGTSPIILIRDPELIRNITVKDFQHFTDHKPFFKEEVEPLFGASLMMMKGERWHSMRTTLSPAFTSSKMRLMLPIITEISNNIVEYLKDHLNEDIDMEDIMRRYTSDVIASAAFGLEVNSLKNKDNEFYTTGRNLFSFTVVQRIYLMIKAWFPSLIKQLGTSLLSEKDMNFFRGIVMDTMGQREKNNIYRPDMIQLLMEASKGTLKGESDANDYSPTNDTSKPKTAKDWTLSQIAAQVFIFFSAGYESSASALVMCIHELALNPDVQEKLYQEIRKHKEEHGKISFETISNIKYLDCVLNETSRKWAAANMLDRICTEAYELPPPRKGLKPVKLQPGDVVYNMVNCIHMDPVHHPNPHKFDPERFSEENKHKIKPFTYTPFGMGPRNCIGIRFALLELQMLMFHLVLNFKILKCPKTMDPVKLKPHEFIIQPKDGSFVRLETRKSTPSPSPSVWSNVWLYAVRARNALVVFAASAVAYILYVKGKVPFKLTGNIEGGLPKFGLPPFATTVNNETLGFDRMLEVFGPEGFVMPLVAILESIAIAKAFAGSATVDATQEMIALGLCNLVSSFAQCMPTTGSFTRTALNHASGVMTPAGTLFKASLVLLSVTLMAETFYFIPRATLAGIIMVAMLSIVDFSLLPALWTTSKSELFIWVLTVLVGITAGLEYGIAAGVVGDALRVLCASARPHMQKQEFKVGALDVVVVSLSGTLSYSCAEAVSQSVRTARACVLVVRGEHVRHMDIGVLHNLISAIEDLEKQKQRCLLWNFPPHIDIDTARRVTGTDIQQIILDLNERDCSLSAVTS